LKAWRNTGGTEHSTRKSKIGSNKRNSPKGAVFSYWLLGVPSGPGRRWGESLSVLHVGGNGRLRLFESLGTPASTIDDRGSLVSALRCA
jgi:hypothetical protein